MAKANFDKVVAVKLGLDWVAVESAEDALDCLQGRWPDKTGASYRRAFNNCEAYAKGEGTMLAARASFMVAAMEAGLLFDVYQDHLAFLEAQIASVAKEAANRDMDVFNEDED